MHISKFLMQPILWRSKTEVQLGLNPTQSVRIPANQLQQLLDSPPEGMQSESCDVRLRDTDSDVTPLHLMSIDREQLSKNDQQLRLDTEITIQGAGRMGTTIAVLLASAGYPTIRIHDDKRVTLADVTAWGASRIDVGTRRDYTAHMIIERIYQGTWPKILRKPKRASRAITILCPDPVADWPWFAPNASDALLANDEAHLAIACGLSQVHITSVIEPGKSACLRCRDAHAVDADSSWPLISAQLIGRPMLDFTPASLVLFAAQFATQQIHAWRCEDSYPSNQMWNIDWPSFDTTTTLMSAHPACGCMWNQA